MDTNNADTPNQPAPAVSIERPTSHLRVAKARITNPEHDRRVRYGWKAVAFIEEGETFLWTPSWQDPERKYPNPAFISLSSTSTALHDEDTAALIAANSEPCEPTTWADVNLEQGKSPMADEVLEHLLTSGAVTVQVLREALAAVIGDPEH